MRSVLQSIQSNTRLKWVTSHKSTNCFLYFTISCYFSIVLTFFSVFICVYGLDMIPKVNHRMQCASLSQSAAVDETVLPAASQNITAYAVNTEPSEGYQQALTVICPLQVKACLICFIVLIYQDTTKQNDWSDGGRRDS